MSQIFEEPISLGAYHLIAYRRALHPELFTVKARRLYERPEHEVEVWVMPGAHMLRHQRGQTTGVELLTHQDSGLPERGVVASFPCAGEKEFDHAFSDEVQYFASVQTETLPPNIYEETRRELLEFALEHDAPRHLWEDQEGAPCASIVHVELRRSEALTEAYHLLGGSGVVLRSQALFELRS